MIAKCPKCEKNILQTSLVTQDGQVSFGNSFKCVLFTCPYCHTVLGAQIDPIAIKSDIVNELFRKLRGAS